MKRWLTFYVFISLFSTEGIAQWDQLGNTINTGIQLYYNHTLSVDLNSSGDICVVGGNYRENATYKIYRYNGSDWQKLGKGVKLYNFYFSHNPRSVPVNLSSDGYTLGLKYHGCIKVFKYNGENFYWKQIGDDISGTVIRNCNFLSDDGSRLVVIDSNKDGNVYEFNGVSWELLGSKFINIQNISISNEGNKVIVDHRINIDSIASRVYEYNGADWDNLNQDFEGDFTLVSPDLNKLYKDSQVYNYDGLDWEVEGGLFNTYYRQDFDFSDKGDVFAISDHSTHRFRGRVRVYKHDDLDWIQVGSDLYDNMDAPWAGSEWFGDQISLNSSGNTLAVAAYHSGAIKICRYSDIENVTSSIGCYIDNETNMVTISPYYSLTTSIESFNVYNVMGQLTQAGNKSNLPLLFEIKGDAGVYFIKVKVDNKEESFKVFKSK